MKRESVVLERGERRAAITIDRPPLNILDLKTLECLSRLLDELATDSSTQLLTLTGGGDRAFSAGVSVEDHTRERIRDSLRVFHQVLRKVAGLPAISIAAVRGHCLGGGMELAGACDFVLAAPDGRFGQPEIDLGCFPPAAAALFPHRIGYQKTLELLATGETLSAAEAHACGFATWLAEDDLEAALENHARRFLDKSAAATRALKRTLHQGRRRLFEEELPRTERAYLDELLATEDMDEGLVAFFEKRAPEWKHR